MAWNASGEERVKNYRIYRELEEKYSEALEENRVLRHALSQKDQLIQRLAAEVANVIKPMPILDEEVLADIPRSRMRTVPVKEDGDQEPTITETPSGSIKGVRPGVYKAGGVDITDPLAHIPTPASKKRKAG